MKRPSSETLENVIITAVGLTAIFGTLYLAQIVTGQSAIEAFKWLIWSTGGLAIIAFAAVIAAVIIMIHNLRRN